MAQYHSSYTVIHLKDKSEFPYLNYSFLTLKGNVVASCKLIQQRL